MKKIVLILVAVTFTSNFLYATNSQTDYRPYFDAIKAAEQKADDINEVIKGLKNDGKTINTHLEEKPETVVSLFNLAKRISNAEKEKKQAKKDIDKAYYRLYLASHGICIGTFTTGLSLYKPELKAAAALVGVTAGLGYFGYKTFIKKTVDSETDIAQ